MEESVEPIPLDPIDSLSVTTLVDNTTDLLLADEGPATRAPLFVLRLSERSGAFPRGRPDERLLRAEHGFSCLVTITKSDRTTKILFDAGVTPDGLVENMRRLELSPRDIDIIVLSHGHRDHTTGMDGLVTELGGHAHVPILIHPEFWSRRRIALPGRDPIELPSRSKPAPEGAGFEIVERRQPSFLLDGSLLVTGEVDRTTKFEQSFPVHQAHRDGGWQPDPLILDDQALVAHVHGHGLVILTGCGHSGIVNILRYVRKLTGESRIHAVIGGFHLGGRLSKRSSRRAAKRWTSSPPTTSSRATAPASAPPTPWPSASPRRSSRTVLAPASSSRLRTEQARIERIAGWTAGRGPFPRLHCRLKQHRGRRRSRLVLVARERKRLRQPLSASADRRGTVE
jgi:7,8-dihydropterin-6-yl-methyl-4-(beta-D-ribofuranosyl)aminobenzene 5'-phosphate synthase